MTNQESITSPNDCNNLPVTNPEDMEICNLPNEEFKIAVLGRLNELQEDTEGQFNKIKKTIHKQNQNFNKEREYKKEPNRNSGAKEYNEWNFKNDIALTSEWNQAKEKIYKLEDRNFAIIQSEDNNNNSNWRIKEMVYG